MTSPLALTVTTTTSTDGRVAVAELRGEVDIYTAPQVRNAILAAIEAGRCVVLGLAGVEFMDSTGLGVLIYTQKAAKAAGLAIAVAGATPQIAKLFTTTGLDKLFPNHPDVPAAQASLAH